MDTALTHIDVDEEALAEAMQLSGGKTKKQTVNLALREFVARHRRVAALKHYAALAEGGTSRAGSTGGRPLAQHDLVVLHDDADFVTAALAALIRGAGPAKNEGCSPGPGAWTGGRDIWHEPTARPGASTSAG